MEEIWKAIKGYEGFYEVSNTGKVRSLDRTDNMKHFHPGKELAQGTHDNGYKVVHLSKLGEARWRTVHRLVAEAFVEKPEGCDIVNHLDNSRDNNNADNLEWTTLKGNMQHATKQGRMHYKPENLRRAQESHKRAVIATDKEGNEYYFPSQVEAVEGLNLSRANKRHIAAACRKDRGYKTVGGYTWRYANE